MVGHRQANVWQPPSSSRSSASTWVACTTVVRGPSTSSAYSSRAGDMPYTTWQASFSRALLGQVDVQRGAGPVGPGHDRVQLAPRHRADGMDGRADPGVRRDHAVGVVAQAGDPRGPAHGVAVAEPQLGPGQRQQPSSARPPDR